MAATLALIGAAASVCAVLAFLGVLLRQVYRQGQRDGKIDQILANNNELLKDLRDRVRELERNRR